MAPRWASIQQIYLLFYQIPRKFIIMKSLAKTLLNSFIYIQQIQ